MYVAKWLLLVSATECSEKCSVTEHQNVEYHSCAYDDGYCNMYVYINVCTVHYEHVSIMLVYTHKLA